MQTKLFLTSQIHVVARDIAKKVNLSKTNGLVFIDTAAEVERGDKTWLKNDRQALVNAGFVVNDYTLTGKTRGQLKIDLNEFNYIYLSGGNTTYLLQQSQESGFISLIQEFIQGRGKVYIGSSAGSIIAGPKLPNYLNSRERIKLKSKNGYGLVNFTVVPHWGCEDFKESYLEKRLKIAYRDDQVPLILLTDSQYIHVQNDQMKIIDVKN